jgi:acetylornithine deacetylase
MTGFTAPGPAERTARALDLLDRLVAFDTVSAKSNLALIEFVRTLLAEHGIDSRLTFHPAGEKANLLATVGPNVAGGVVLSGHTDVVPVDGQPWTADPFRCVRRDGRVHGRGTADMKGFIACALSLLPMMRARPLQVPIHFAFSYDEELGCLGVPALIDDMAAVLPRPRLAIVGEPTRLRIADRHKGIHGFETMVTGRDGHSSATHRGVNAISAAAELVLELERIAARFRDEGPFDSAFDPPYTTLNIGTIEGGAAVNIIARSCTLRWETRPLPGDDPAEIVARLDRFAREELLPRLRRIAPEADIVTRPTVSVAGLKADPDSPAAALMRRLTGANATIGVAFTTEAGLFQRALIPAIVCGPGDIAQAHQPDEYVEIAEIEGCLDLLAKVIGWARDPVDLAG